MTSNATQRSFVDGEISPSLFARTDTIKYARGLRTCRNMIVQRHGGAANRPGFGFIAGAKDSSVASRLIEFVLDATDVTDTYVLEFGAGYIRFYQDGARVTVSPAPTAWADVHAYVVGDLVSQGGVYYYCIVNHTSAAATDQPGTGSSWNAKWYALSGTIYEIPTPYTTADLADLCYKQVGNVIRIVHPAYAVRDLTRLSSTDWTLATVTFGPAIDPPGSLAAAGAAGAVNTYYAVTAVAEGSLEESLASTYHFVGAAPSGAAPVTLTWNNVAGALSYNVYRSTDTGNTYALIASAGGTPVGTSDVAWGDSDETANSGAAGVWVPAVGQLRNALAIGATTKAYDGNYTVAFKWTLVAGAGGLGASGRIAWYYSRDAETRVFAGYTTTRSIHAPGTTSGSDTITIAVPDNGYVALTIDGVPEVQQLAGPVAACTMNGNTAVGPDNSVAWSVAATQYIDSGATADYTQAPPTQQTLFNAVGAYPAAVGDYQQRCFLGNTGPNPNKLWGSRSGSRDSFAMSTPLQDDDLIAFTLVSNRAHVVKHLLDLHGLVVFTTAGVFVVGGNDADVLTPDSIRPKQIAENGIGRVRPLPVDRSALYVQGRGAAIRDLVPVQSGGGLGGYEGTDLTIFSSHLFKSYAIIDWAYAEEPFGVVWCVRSDGVLLSLTYLREFGTWGWARHDGVGTVESVCVVPEGAEDAVYVVVNRTINGATVRSVERMASRFYTDIVDAVFMDGAVTVDGRHTGTTTMTLSGGVTWGHDETLTLTASVAYFVAGDVGNWIYLRDADDLLVRCEIEGYTGATVVTVRPDRTVPLSMRAVAIGNGSGSWGKAVLSVTGLSHLEGERVAVLGDGFVLASPNNRYLDDAGGTVYNYADLIVAAGAITLPEPAMVIHVGLPYLADMETLDLDMAGGRSMMHTKKLVAQIGLYLESTRGVFAGRPDLWSDDDPLKGLDEMVPRSTETYDEPPALVTDYREIPSFSDWGRNGRVLIRQADPLPITVLSISPIGYGT